MYIHKYIYIYIYIYLYTCTYVCIYMYMEMVLPHPDMYIVSNGRVAQTCSCCKQNSAWHDGWPGHAVVLHRVYSVLCTFTSRYMKLYCMRLKCIHPYLVMIAKYFSKTPHNTWTCLLSCWHVVQITMSTSVTLLRIIRAYVMHFAKTLTNIENSGWILIHLCGLVSGPGQLW